MTGQNGLRIKGAAGQRVLEEYFFVHNMPAVDKTTNRNSALQTLFHSRSAEKNETRRIAPAGS
ncbi:hypothetical protein [Ferrovibrio sp.]|uniref:hypothetical protein n=1 Tax=Ferrovibrio sp. TaxID=1917215 RepID=UPI0025BC50BE|nr:hypothetical protein [Ferrovibrio sp.]MBX3455875.1 hypothetical protein [Ferrovibrio sp.]